jgi:acyl-CoA dehydrogenase
VTLSYQLSQPLVEYGRTVSEWAKTECRPYAREADTRHQVPDNWPEILDTCPVSIGRYDKPEASAPPRFEEGRWVSGLVMTESLFYGDTWVSFVLGAGIGHLVVKLMGTAEQIERWYRPIVDRRGVTAFALTEPQFGSDTSMVATTAVRDGDTWVLNGTKIYCSLGGIADYTVVFATTDKSLGPSAIKAFVVPRGTPGLTIAKMNEDKLGIRSSLTSELFFDDCHIPVENLLGWAGDDGAVATDAKGKVQTRSGRGGALGALAQNKPNISAMGIGLSQASIDVATDILAEQKTGFTPKRWSAIETELSNMSAALDRARRVNWKAQWLSDQRLNSKTEASMSKAYGPPTFERIIRRCMQLLGPEGTSTDLLLEKWYRDVKILDIFEGSGQVQRIIIGRTLMGPDAGRG